MNFRLFGVKFKISFLFTALLAFSAATDKTGELSLFFVAAFIHELSHLTLMCFLKSPPSEIKLIPGGITIVQKCSVTPFFDFLILVAGPLSNLICFLCFNGSFKTINLLLFVFNILPIEGLDGASILKIILNVFLKEEIVDIFLFLLTVLFTLVFIIAFIYGFAEGIKNYTLLIFSLYIISAYFLKKRLKEKNN